MTRLAQTIGVALAALGTTMLFSGPAAGAEAVYSNPTAIVIPDHGLASPYPSPVGVQGLPGRITDVNVALRRFSHARASDVDVLLVSPEGETTILMSDSCNGSAEGSNWIFDQDAASQMDIRCPGVVYRPTDVQGATADSWPGAPPGPHDANLDRFVGGNPNGTWSLRVVDDLAFSPPFTKGAFELGWSLSIETETPDALVPGPGQGGLASPYWTTRTISGMTGVITDVNVSLGGIYHERPGDLDLLLVGPRGEKVMLMSGACGDPSTKNARWGWDDEAAGRMNRITPCPTGVYQPSHNEPGDMPGPAPPSPYAAPLSAFDDTDPNGEWRLYAYDDQPGGADGFFVERFMLDIETRPRAATGFTETAIVLTEGETQDLTIRRDTGAQGFGEGAVTVTSAPLSATSGADYAPISTTVEFARGQQDVTVPVAVLEDVVPEGEETFAVTLGQPSGDAALNDASTALVTIRDDDADPGPVGDPLPGGGGGRGVDRDAPVIGRVTLTPARFAVARRATARTAGRGTRIRYTLSEPAAVTLRFQRATTGRRVGRSCRRITARNSRGRPCRRYVAAGTLRRAGRPGANRVAFSGRVGRRALQRGAHRLIVTAVDQAGNSTTSRPRRFRVVR